MDDLDIRLEQSAQRLILCLTGTVDGAPRGRWPIRSGTCPRSLTWFEYAPEHADDFERLVDELRATEEWRHVEREVDLRLSRQPGP